MAQMQSAFANLQRMMARAPARVQLAQIKRGALVPVLLSLLFRAWVAAAVQICLVEIRVQTR